MKPFLQLSLTVASLALLVTMLNAVTAVSFDRADVSVRYFIGVTTCLFAQIMFWRRQHLLREWLGLLIGEARRLEQDDGQDDGQDHGHAAAADEKVQELAAPGAREARGPRPQPRPQPQAQARRRAPS